MSLREYQNVKPDPLSDIFALYTHYVYDNVYTKLEAP